MSMYLVLLLALLCSAAAQPRVAVIGGGVSGASAVHYLRQELGNDVEITVFERERLGGRARELEYEGLTLELGASIIWGKNYLMSELAAAAGLEREDAEGGGSGERLFAIYDGRELVFAQSRWAIITLIKFIWRYWLSWFGFRGAPAATFNKFQGIYALLDQGRGFDRPVDLLRAVDLYDLTQQSMFEWLRENMGESADRLASELIAGVNKCNYNQGNWGINALAGMVSLLPTSDPSVFRLKGGNGRLAPALLERANASVRCPAAVGAVRHLDDGRFALEASAAAGIGHAGHKPVAGEAEGMGAAGLGHAGHKPVAGEAEGMGAAAVAAAAAAAATTEGGTADLREVGAAAAAAQLGVFDAVVVAAPLEGSGIQLLGFKPPILPARKYQQTVTTFVKGAVRPSYFGLEEMIYSTVLVAEGAQVPWSVLGLAGRTAPSAASGGGNETVWKLFSQEAMPHAWLSMMFESGFEVVASQTWNAPGAYPAFDPPEDFAPFKLTDGLFYTAALENAASAMEIAAIEGRLAAQATARHIRARRAWEQAAAEATLLRTQGILAVHSTEQRDWLEDAAVAA